MKLQLTLCTPLHTHLFSCRKALHQRGVAEGAGDRSHCWRRSCEAAGESCGLSPTRFPVVTHLSWPKPPSLLLPTLTKEENQANLLAGQSVAKIVPDVTFSHPWKGCPCSWGVPPSSAAGKGRTESLVRVSLYNASCCTPTRASWELCTQALLRAKP